MSNERRHLRFLITSALLVGPALGCGGPEPEPNTVAPEPETVPETNTQFDHPIETQEIEEPPTGNPVGPEPTIEPQPLLQPEPEPDTNVGR